MSDNDRILLELDLRSSDQKDYMLFMLEAGIKLYAVHFHENTADVAEAVKEHAEIVTLVHEEWPLTPESDRVEMFEESARALLIACGSTDHTIVYVFDDGAEIEFGNGLLADRVAEEKPVGVRVVKDA